MAFLVRNYINIIEIKLLNEFVLIILVCLYHLLIIRKIISFNNNNSNNSHCHWEPDISSLSILSAKDHLSKKITPKLQNTAAPNQD